MLTIQQNVAAHSMKSTNYSVMLNERPPPPGKKTIFIMELLINDMATIPEFLEGIWFES